MEFPFVSQRLVKRRDNGLLRTVNNIFVNENMIDLSSNDYMDMSRNEVVCEAAKAAVDRFGCSASSSPLVSGFKEAHEELLDQLNRWYGFSCGMIWNSGYSANRAILGLLPKKGDVILADRLIHNSMITGILESGARLIRYTHCDLDDLEKLLCEYAVSGRRVFVAMESIYSMDGDYVDLRKVAALKQRYPFFWILDEAHAIGWYGESGSGLAEEQGVVDSVDILVGTMGKGLGAMGAYTMIRDDSIKSYLENFSVEFIYSTYLTPVMAVAAKVAIDVLLQMGSAREEAQRLSVDFRKRIRGIGFEVAEGDSAIVPILIGDIERMKLLGDTLFENGFMVGRIRPPTVPKGGSRLRVSLKWNLPLEAQDRFVNLLEAAG